MSEWSAASAAEYARQIALQNHYISKTIKLYFIPETARYVTGA